MTRKENSIGYLKTFLLLLFVGLDYIAIILAEEAAFLMRNTFFHSSHLHISWLNFWLVFPCLYIFFINLGQLYSRRRPFYKEVEQLFQAVFYGTAAVIFVLYVARIAVHTSRFFVGAFGILAFIFWYWVDILVKTIYNAVSCYRFRSLLLAQAKRQSF